MRLPILAAAAAAALLSAPAQAATLAGDEVAIAFTIGVTTFASNNGPVSPSVSAAATNGDASISGTISDGLIVLTYDLTGFGNVGSSSTWSFTGLDFTPVAEVSALTLVSGNAALVTGQSFTADSITIGIVNIDTASQGVVNTLEFTFANAETGVAVPLPAALPLGLVGLAALGIVGRRRA